LSCLPILLLLGGLRPPIIFYQIISKKKAAGNFVLGKYTAVNKESCLNWVAAGRTHVLLLLLEATSAARECYCWIGQVLLEGAAGALLLFWAAAAGGDPATATRLYVCCCCAATVTKGEGCCYCLCLLFTLTLELLVTAVTYGSYRIVLKLLAGRTFLLSIKLNKAAACDFGN